MKWLDDRIDAWHYAECSTDVPPLHEHLGMSQELYARWVEKPPKYVLGLDEVGYGALAGPLVVGGVLAPAAWEHPAMKDSKAFSGPGKERARADAVFQLAGVPGLRCFTNRVSPEDVDKVGVYKAKEQAFADLVAHVLYYFEKTHGNILIVLDGDDPIPGVLHVLLPKADSFVPQVMAASIVAKVQRDTEMRLEDERFPAYGFASHKGYGSPEHQRAIIQHGLCPIHRKSYKMKFLPDSATTSAG